LREKFCQQKSKTKAKNRKENEVTIGSGKTDGNTLSKTVYTSENNHASEMTHCLCQAKAAAATPAPIRLKIVAICILKPHNEFDRLLLAGNGIFNRKYN
jgi:hypothetical protein